MGEPFIGEIRMFGGNFAPAGWALCQGQQIPISQNDTLFNLIGTIYGGDGQETFDLPNLSSRIPVHAGQGPGLSQNYQLGETFGVEQVTLSTQQIPVHNHSMLASNEFGQNSSPTGGYYAQIQAGQLYHEPFDPTVVLNPGALSPVGGSQPHENMMPFLCINFIISLYGIYPPMN